MLYIIGLGLSSEKDITIKGLEAIRKSSKIYLENYTSKLSCSIEDLEDFYGKKIMPADRDLIEKRAEQTILKDAAQSDTCLLVIGDPFSATTHTDIYLRAKKLGIQIKIINNASILNSIGLIGLELYKYGRTVSIPFSESAQSFYEFYKKNRSIDLHTLFLLDLNPKDDNYMTIHYAIERLIILGLPENKLCIGCAGIGTEHMQIYAGKATDILNYDFSVFPQCLVLPGNLHFVEEEAIEQWKQT